MQRVERVAQIIDAISQEGPLSVRDLTGKLPGITDEDYVRRIVAKAAAKGVGVLESRTDNWDLPRALTANRGNATRYVGITRDAGCAIGLNIGRTYFAIGVADPNGRLISTERGSPPKGDSRKAVAARRQYERGQVKTYEREEGAQGATLLRQAARRTREWMLRVKVEPHEVRAATLSLPAPVSTTASTLLTSSIETPLAAVPHIASTFKAALAAGYPRLGRYPKLAKAEFPNLKKVVVANDADMAARGEVRYGAAYGREDVIVVHAAYGIGAGILSGGSVLRTVAGGGAGEIGHCVPAIMRDEGAGHGLIPFEERDDRAFICSCRQPGHLEGMAGGEAIVRRIRRSPDLDPPPRLTELLADPDAAVAKVLDEVIRSAFGDNPWEPGREALLDAAHLIGGAVHTLAHVVRPEAIYVCGKLSEAGPDFLDEVVNGFQECGPLSGYTPKIALGTAADQFGRRHVMVRGAAMTAVRSTQSLLRERELAERLGVAVD